MGRIQAKLDQNPHRSCVTFMTDWPNAFRQSGDRPAREADSRVSTGRTLKRPLRNWTWGDIGNTHQGHREFLRPWQLRRNGLWQLIFPSSVWTQVDKTFIR